MKNPLFPLLSLVVIALLIAGFIYLHTATSSSGLISEAARKPALVAGLSCLGSGVGLMVLGLFLLRKQD